MSDFPKLVMFGSFTEEETRALQKNSVERQKSSSQTTRLQFGSVDFNTVLSSKNLNSETKGADSAKKSDSLSTSRPVSKVDTKKIKNAVIPAKAKEVVVSQVNGNLDECIHSSKLIEKDASFSQKSDSSSTSSSVSRSDAPKIRDAAIPAKAKDIHSLANGSVSKYTPNLKSVENGKVGISLSSICISDENKNSDAINRDADIDSSKDATESSSESESYHISPAAVSSSEEFPKRHTNNSLNAEHAAVKPLLPCGLINSGNLCFLNATLQALLSCSLFVRLLQDLRASNIPKTLYPTVHAFVEFIANFDMPNDLFSKMSEQSIIETGSSFIPAMFESVLRSFTPDLPSNMSSRPRQEDAQEFLSFVMDRLHDELLKLDGYHSDSNGGLSSIVSSQEDDGWETVGRKNKSSVTRTQSLMPSKLSDIFGGELKSVVKARGNIDSATVQPFLLLHLDIFPDAVHTILDALNLFAAPETLEGYKTAGGKAGVVCASKHVKIQKLSKILILHLMRFSYGNRGSAKLHKPVHFPLDFVIERKLLDSPTAESRKYELVATITHHGRDPSRGHYTADARYSNGRWLHYDDASVTAVPTSKVLHDQAYVLFYRQV